MSDSSQSQKKLKIVSLQPKVAIIQPTSSDMADLQDESDEDGPIVAPLWVDKEKVIEDVSELIDKVYEEFSEACDKKKLDWTAELELGMEFGVKFAVKLSISPKSPQ